MMRPAIVRPPNLCVELLQRILFRWHFVFLFLPGLCGILSDKRHKYDCNGSRGAFGVVKWKIYDFVIFFLCFFPSFFGSVLFFQVFPLFCIFSPSFPPPPPPPIIIIIIIYIQFVVIFSLQLTHSTRLLGAVCMSVVCGWRICYDTTAAGCCVMDVYLHPHVCCGSRFVQCKE